MAQQYRRQPTPEGVFWMRRAFVFGVPALIIFLIFNALTGSPQQQANPKAALAASTPTASPTHAAVAGPVAGPAVPTPSAGTPLASPDGPCAAAEVIAVPSVAAPTYIGTPVTITVQLTATRPACTFHIDGKSLAVKILRGNAGIWTTQDCPNAVTAADVIVRSGVPTPVTVTWDGRRSAGACGGAVVWATTDYSVMAAVVGSAPSQGSFSLQTPPPPPPPPPSPTPAPAPAPTPPTP